MLFSSSLCLVSAHHDISFTGTHWLCVNVCRDAWLNRKGEKEGESVLYCKYVSVWRTEVCWMTHPRWLSLSPLFLPPLTYAFCVLRHQTPTDKLFFYLGYRLTSYNGQRFYFCGPAVASAVLIEMSHVEVDSSQLYYLLFSYTWRVL